jgi:RNA polymerase sigma-70 factor (ECF subfamily)
LEEVVSTAISTEDDTWRAELSRSVLLAVSDLPMHLRVVVVLRYYADLSEREIAIAVGRRPGTVKSRLHEARRRLAANPELQALMVEDSNVGKEAFQ